MQITVNKSEAMLQLKAAVTGHRPELLKICGQYMLGSVMRTFADQGSPAGSWAPLAPWRRSGAASKIGFRLGKTTGSARGKGAMKGGKQILMGSGRLKSSVMFEVQAEKVLIGSNLKYARIHQLGGVAGRRSPSGKRKKGAAFRRPFIPARPYLVFRPEDPANMQAACDRFLQTKIDQAGLGGKR